MTTNKLIDDTMNNAADIMDSRITRNQEIINAVISTVSFPCPENEALIDALRKDNEELMAAIAIIRSGGQWI